MVHTAWTTHTFAPILRGGTGSRIASCAARIALWKTVYSLLGRVVRSCKHNITLKEKLLYTGGEAAARAGLGWMSLTKHGSERAHSVFRLQQRLAIAPAKVHATNRQYCGDQTPVRGGQHVHLHVSRLFRLPATIPSYEGEPFSLCDGLPMSTIRRKSYWERTSATTCLCRSTSLSRRHSCDYGPVDYVFC